MTDTETAGTCRVLVTGSRDWDAEEVLRQALISAAFRGPQERDLIVVHGACPTGADAMVNTWAKDYGFPAERHPADWTGYGKSAGFIRNAEMVVLGADICLAFYKQGAGNKGTDHCASLAEKAGIPVRRVTS
jgi:hypothetical protein